MLNKVMLIGRLGRDPELRYTQNGTPVTSLNVATDESYTDRDGNRQERTEWHRVAVFQKQAELCSNYLSKGSLVTGIPQRFVPSVCSFSTARVMSMGCSVAETITSRGVEAGMAITASPTSSRLLSRMPRKVTSRQVTAPLRLPSRIGSGMMPR